MNKPEQYKKCLSCEKDLSEAIESNWYNDLHKYMDGSQGISTNYIDVHTGLDTLHLANPEKDIGRLCLTINKKLDEAKKIKGCVLQDVLYELYSTMRKEYDLKYNKRTD